MVKRRGKEDDLFAHRPEPSSRALRRWTLVSRNTSGTGEML
jgi:hypothetical protein